MHLLPDTRVVLGWAGRPIPRFGSPEWHALPRHDDRREAAVWIAAEMWRDHCSPERIAEELRRELAFLRRLVDQEILRAHRQTSADVRHALRATLGPDWWKAPSYAELQRRQSEVGPVPGCRAS